MATETVAIRSKNRQVKNHILDQYLKLAVRVEDKGLDNLSENEATKYWDLTLTFAKNVLPREMTGEEGEAIKIQIVQYGDKDTLPMGAGETPVTDTAEPKQV